MISPPASDGLHYTIVQGQFTFDYALDYIIFLIALGGK
jgi:hypothetical protein